MPTCKGRKKDGTPCTSPIVLDNGYCRAHQDQAREASPRQCREALETAIAENGGPEKLDLAGADLSGLYLEGMDLRQANLTCANLQKTILGSANLQEANLEGALLQRSNLDKANLQGANLRGANLQGAWLLEANLRGANLVDIDLQSADVRFADLRGADLMGANLQGAGLYDANLQGANLLTADLQRAGLGGANLQKTDLWEADLQDANLGSTSLQRAVLVYANLRGASLVATDLQGADLRRADLRGVNLLDARDLLGIRLYRAKLDRTVLRREQLGPAIGDEQAGEHREAQDAYLALKQNFEALGDYDAASWAYIKERQMEKACSAPWRARRFYGEEQLGDTRDHRVPAYHPHVWWFFVRHTAKWLSDWLVELVCGYGERPWRTLAAIAVVFAVFVGIYWATWAVVKVESASDGATLLVPTRNLVDLVIFSLGAFTTMDAKGLEPRTVWVQVLTGIEALLGIGLTGLLGFVLGNRIRRS